MKTALKAVAALAVIWIVVGIVMWQSEEHTVTAESLTLWIEENPLPDDDSRRREQIIREMADQYNRLGYEERRLLRGDNADGPPGFARRMTDDECRLFVELTVSASFDQLMQALNSMEPEERQKLAQRALDQVREDGLTPAELAEMEDEEREIVERITNEGLRAYFEEASAETKLDLAPVLEQMQQNLRKPAYHRKDKK